MSRLILGITGKKQVGKDTFAKAISRTYPRTLVRRMAQPIYDMLLVGLGLRLKDQSYGSWVDEYGFPLKRFVDIEPVNKDEPINSLDASMRKLLQTLGTEWGRDTIHPDIWVKQWVNWYHQIGYSADVVVIPDVRMDNEASTILSLGGKIIEIQRSTCLPSDLHKTEAGVNSTYVSEVFVNNGDIGWLYLYVERMLDRWMRPE